MLSNAMMSLQRNAPRRQHGRISGKTRARSRRARSCGIRRSARGKTNSTPIAAISPPKSASWARRILRSTPASNWIGKVASPISVRLCTPTTRSNNAQRAASVIDRLPNNRSATIFAASPARPIGAAIAMNAEPQVSLKQNQTVRDFRAERAARSKGSRAEADTNSSVLQPVERGRGDNQVWDSDWSTRLDISRQSMR